MTDTFSEVRQKEPELLCHTTACCPMLKPNTDSPPNVRVHPETWKCYFLKDFWKSPLPWKLKLCRLSGVQNHCKPFQGSAERLRFWATPLSSEGTLVCSQLNPRAPWQRQTRTCGCSTQWGPKCNLLRKIFSFQPQDKKSVLKCTEETHGWSPIPQ